MVGAQGARALKFVPHADLSIVDPSWTTDAANAVSPYIPLGQMFSPMAYRKEITGVLDGYPLFWNVKRG